MDALEQARAEIDTVDAQLAALFERRMAAVLQVAEYKRAHGLPVYDAARETAVLDLWGTKSILSSVGVGQAFAETYAFCGEALMVDAVAAEHCEILFLHTAALTDARIEPALKDKLLRRLLAVSMRKNLSLSQRIFCTTPKTVRGRLLTYFSAQAARCGRMAFEVPFNRQQMADYLNLDRSALSKELCKMRDEGLLEFDKNRFVLKQLPE